MKVRADSRFGHIGKYELGEPKSLGINPTQGVARETPIAGINTSRLSGDLRRECRWPAALHKVVPVVEQKNTRILEVCPHPNWRVQRGGKTVTGSYRGNKALLKRQGRGQP